MLSFLRVWRIWIPLLASMLVLALMIANSKAFEDCVDGDYAANAVRCGVGFVATKEGEDLIVALGTIWIAIFTGTLWHATTNLWRSTDRLAFGTERSAERQLRAYVFLDPVDEFTFVRRPSTIATVEVEIHVKNLGATPAHEVVADSWMTMDVWPMPQEFSFVGPPGTEPTTKSVLPPGGTVHFHTGTSRPFSDAELAEIQNGNRRLYIFGQIRYTDTFNRPHWTNFCQASTALGREGFRTAMAKCDRHNDADTD